MRRALVRSFGPIRYAFRHHGVAKRLLILNINDGNYERSAYNSCKCGGPYMFSRNLSSDAADVSYKEGKRGGPLVEYERRIAAGDLEDGDISQLGTLKEIQRLYDELVVSADACRLDRYSDYGKAGR
ncbi:hypothetical protein M8C21_013146 [Ambrosia artemisiifolia]|uniref:Uncharacterized protein n=1 Tax=Ambrosia artemisiifolia TaxID=4212 RepID=A0AAD5BQH4_AMBAR|nr:hypothetical protein M8C21_013146 [Ambrosia artemisiifolia]